jgi:hypothetical protein
MWIPIFGAAMQLKNRIDSITMGGAIDQIKPHFLRNSLWQALQVSRVCSNASLIFFKLELELPL